MHILWGLVSGLVFGVGLVVSGMADPSKVLNFLDLAGQWDPSLAFVMGGAVAVSFVGYRLVWQRERPVLEDEFDLPKTTGIDPRLVAGATVFGIGWGIGGFCPGPVLTSVPLLAAGTLVFVPAMLLGMLGGFHARSLKLPTGREKESAT